MATTNTSPDREQILNLLGSNIEALNERIQRMNEEAPTSDEEQLQLKRLQTVAQLASQYRLLARDMDIDEMEAELSLLEQATDLRGETK